MDSQAIQFNGRPVGVAFPSALEHLAEASDLLDSLQRHLDQPIADILTPPKTVPFFDRAKRVMTEQPGPSPRQAAMAHAQLLSSLLDFLAEPLKLARFTITYRVSTFCQWGASDDLVVRPMPLPDDIENRYALIHLRRKRLYRAVRAKQRRLREALEKVIEEPEPVFRLPRTLQCLTRGTQPLVRRIKRFEDGVCYERT